MEKTGWKRRGQYDLLKRSGAVLLSDWIIKHLIRSDVVQKEKKYYGKMSGMSWHLPPLPYLCIILSNHISFGFQTKKTEEAI